MPPDPMGQFSPHELPEGHDQVNLEWPLVLSNSWDYSAVFYLNSPPLLYLPLPSPPLPLPSSISPPLLYLPSPPLSPPPLPSSISPSPPLLYLPLPLPSPPLSPPPPPLPSSISPSPFPSLCAGNVSPRYMRSTMYTVPCSKDLLNGCRIPMGFVIQAFANDPQNEVSSAIPEIRQYYQIRIWTKQRKNLAGLIGN